MASREGSYVSTTVRLARTLNELSSLVRLIGRAYSNWADENVAGDARKSGRRPFVREWIHAIVRSASTVALTPSAGAR